MKKINKVILELYNDKKQILFLAFLTLLDYLTKDILIGDTEVYHATMGVVAIVGAAVAVGGAVMGAVGARKNRKDAEAMANEAKIERDAQQKLLDQEKAEYEAMEFKNPFERMENVYANLENPYEDLTVNQQQAQFQAQQGAQQRANIMQNLRGAAGGSGIAGLAQAMANQGQLATQQISASIGQQESRNQALRAQGAASNIQLEAQGAAAVQTAQRQGEQWVQQQEIGRQSTLLGMQMGQTAGAEQAYAGAQSNVMQAKAAERQAYANIATTAGQAGLSVAGSGAFGKTTPTTKLGNTGLSGGQQIPFGGSDPLNTGNVDFSSMTKGLPKFNKFTGKFE